jgi:hypothetical protein
MLMLTSAFDEPAFLNKTIKNANFLNTRTMRINEIMRNYKITRRQFMASWTIMRLLFWHDCTRLGKWLAI